MPSLGAENGGGLDESALIVWQRDFANSTDLNVTTENQKYVIDWATQSEGEDVETAFDQVLWFFGGERSSVSQFFHGVNLEVLSDPNGEAAKTKVALIDQRTFKAQGNRARDGPHPMSAYQLAEALFKPRYFVPTNDSTDANTALPDAERRLILIIDPGPYALLAVIRSASPTQDLAIRDLIANYLNSNPRSRSASHQESARLDLYHGQTIREGRASRGRIDLSRLDRSGRSDIYLEPVQTSFAIVGSHNNSWVGLILRDGRLTGPKAGGVEEIHEQDQEAGGKSDPLRPSEDADILLDGPEHFLCCFQYWLNVVCDEWQTTIEKFIDLWKHFAQDNASLPAPPAEADLSTHPWTASDSVTWYLSHAQDLHGELRSLRTALAGFHNYERFFREVIECDEVTFHRVRAEVLGKLVDPQQLNSGLDDFIKGLEARTHRHDATQRRGQDDLAQRGHISAVVVIRLISPWALAAGFVQAIGEFNWALALLVLVGSYIGVNLVMDLVLERPRLRRWLRIVLSLVRKTVMRVREFWRSRRSIKVTDLWHLALVWTSSAIVRLHNRLRKTSGSHTQDIEIGPQGLPSASSQSGGRPAAEPPPS